MDGYDAFCDLYHNVASHAQTTGEPTLEMMTPLSFLQSFEASALSLTKTEIFQYVFLFFVLRRYFDT